jgi:hypothetical protein
MQVPQLPFSSMTRPSDGHARALQRDLQKGRFLRRSQKDLSAHFYRLTRCLDTAWGCIVGDNGRQPALALTSSVHTLVTALQPVAEP